MSLEKLPKMDIYRTSVHPAMYGMPDDIFDKIEEALGFKLFAWQKYYILTGQVRQSGRSTADALRDLIRNKNVGINYLRPAATHYEKNERDNVLRIYHLLKESGIETCPILLPKSAKQKNIENMEKAIANLTEQLEIMKRNAYGNPD